MHFAPPDAQTVARALKILEHYTRGAKAWFEDAEQAWIRGTLAQRTDDEALGVARLVFERDDSAASTTAQLVAQTSPAALALHDAPARAGGLARRQSVRAATADELKRVAARGSRLTGGRISSRTQVEGSFVFDILFGELVEPGADGELLPPLSNPPILDCTPDLTTLSYLHEPAVLHNLRRRYERHDIYTYSGVVLVAMNPFSPVQLYSPEAMARYARAASHAADPHLFAIAENAYRGMVNDRRNQTIIVYGESGSGKTTSAKYIMRYFAQAHHADTNDVQMSTVENQILATNPVFESFGNAKTTRNDNSSRFGKFLDIKFERERQQIVGGRIRTFLLERSRVVYQPPTERNYHIFYQLLAGADAELRARLRLDGEYAACGAFHYTNQGGAGSAAIPGVDDAADFAETDASLEMVGIDGTQRGHIWRTLAGILHLGNVEFSGSESTGSFVGAESEPQFAIAAELLGVGEAKLRQWLTKRQIVTRHDNILAKVNKTQALVIRDSIAKFIYARLFDWILGPINASLLPTQVDEGQTSFVGVLDIYGFEHFEHNSFEQFCINYANEKLQQNFNHHVFKIEQEEYRREQLENWTFIGFQDNQPCIDLIEGKPIGILALLDEESRLEQGSDRTFTEKLYVQFGSQQQASASYFRKPRFSNTAFTIRHYAHDVTYEGDGFLEKNKDTVPDEVLDLLCTSSFEFVGALASSHAAQVAPAKASPGTPAASVGGAPQHQQRRQAPTLTGVFKRSLAGLMATLAETEMHYIRCIKPNEAKRAWLFEAPMVLSQLRSCGVIETIRISKAGYPSRVPIRTFNARYAVLLGDSAEPPAPDGDTLSAAEHAVCRQILDASLPDRAQYQVGLTKVFFRAGQWAIMEKKRSFLFESSAVVMQRFCRGALVRRSYRAMAAAARTIQRWHRARMLARKYELARRLHAARVIERHYAQLLRRRRRAVEDRAATVVQAHVRGFDARRRVRRMREGQQQLAAARARDQADAARRAADEERLFAEQARRDAESGRIRAAAQAARAKAQAAEAAAGQAGPAHSRQRSTGAGSRDSATYTPPEATFAQSSPQPQPALGEALARLTLNSQATANTQNARTRHAARSTQAAARAAPAAKPVSMAQPDARRDGAPVNDAVRQRTAEARASLLAAGVAVRTAEAELMRHPQHIVSSSNYSMYRPGAYSARTSSSTAATHARGDSSDHEALAISDDLYAIINEFSVVADGRYGEVDARSLRRLPRVQSAATSPARSPRARSPPAPSPMLGSRAPTPATDPHVAKRESLGSMATSAATADYGGRHTAARARAWAARQKSRVFGAFDKSQRRAQQPAEPPRYAAADMPLEPPPALRFHHPSLSATNISAPAPTRLSKIPSAGNLH